MNEDPKKDVPRPPKIGRSRPEMSQVVEKMFDDTAFWQLVFLIGATLIASVWNLDVVREGLFGLLGQDRTDRLTAALEDPSEDVAARACAAILTGDDGLIPPQLIRTLYLRPTVAFACLEQSTATVEARRADKAAAEEAPSEDDWHNPFYRREVELVPHHEIVASTLGQRWMTDLFEGTSNACETAHNARRALEYARLDPEYRLMSCAVAAESEQVRQCCVAQLGGEEAFVGLLDRPDKVPLRQASDDYRALVGASFPSVPTAAVALDRRRRSHDEQAQNAPVDNGEARFDDLQFDVQDWVIDVGCRLHFFEASRQKVPQSFVPLVESDGCAPTEVAWQGMHTSSSWTKTCIDTYAYRRSQAYTPREALCKSLGDATVARAISVTSLIVAASVSEAQATPGIQRDDLELAGDNFGARLYGFRHGEAVDKDEEPESSWKGDGTFSPMEGL